MSSLQTRTACKKLGHELGFAVVSPLGDLIYSPHDSLEAFFDYISKKHRGLRSKKAFNESLDHDYNVAIFQSILYNGLMFSLERFCNSSSVLTTRDRYRSFIQWLDPPKAYSLVKITILLWPAVDCFLFEKSFKNVRIRSPLQNNPTVSVALSMISWR